MLTVETVGTQDVKRPSLKVTNNSEEKEAGAKTMKFRKELKKRLIKIETAASPRQRKQLQDEV